MAYFKPMLSDQSLTMCQDVTPNTAEGKEMMYAICWNESGTKMVQVGILPVRLLQELQDNEISEVVEGMPSYAGIDIIVANRKTQEIESATISGVVGKTMDSIGFPAMDECFDDISYHSAKINGVWSYCALAVDNEYIIGVVQDKNAANQSVLTNILVVSAYLVITVGIMVVVIRKLTKSILKEQKNANTDKLTGLPNRRGYENALLMHPEVPAEENFVYISMDLKGIVL